MQKNQECKRCEALDLNEKVIKLDVNNGVYTMDMWVCLDEAGPVFN